MGRIRGFRTFVLAVALAPVFAVLSVVVNTPPAGALTTTERQALASEVFNDDCSRANPPDECQQQVPGNDDCLRANPPDECQFSGGGVLQVLKFCIVAPENEEGLPAGPVCIVVVLNNGPVPIKGIVLKDVLQPSSAAFTDFFPVAFGDSGPVVGTPCPTSGNTARCRVGTLQPLEAAVFIGALACPEGLLQGDNTATVTARNAPRQTVSAPFVCELPPE